VNELEKILKHSLKVLTGALTMALLMVEMIAFAEVKVPSRSTSWYLVEKVQLK
jgi:hypothetical protein